MANTKIKVLTNEKLFVQSKVDTVLRMQKMDEFDKSEVGQPSSSGGITNSKIKHQKSRGETISLAGIANKSFKSIK